LQPRGRNPYALAAGERKEDDHMNDRVQSMHRKLARRLAPIAIVAIFGVTAAACGSSGGGSTSGPSNTKTTSGSSGSGSGSGGSGF
jgi:hypothetical protein